MIGIYEIYNGATSKSYIGSSVNIGKRLRDHKYDLRNNQHDNLHLQRAWNKYGEGCFTFKIIQETTADDLLETEQFWIDFYNATNVELGYNILAVAGNSTGYRHNDETIQKMKNTHKVIGISQSATVAAAIANRKQYIIMSPDGIEYDVDNLTLFANERGLDSGQLNKIARGVIQTHKGYTCRYK